MFRERNAPTLDALGSQSEGNAMTDEYARHLAQLHARFRAPRRIIRQAARELTKNAIASTRRIVAGESNEVYAIEFSDGLEVIMRIARGSTMGFAHERWAIERCADLDIPVPGVLVTVRYGSAREALDVCILEKLEGERLSDSLHLPRETLRAVVNQAGEVLSRLHTIQTEGAGGVDGRGHGEFQSYEAFFDDFMAQEAQFVAVAERTGFDRDGLHRALRYAEQTAWSLAPIRICLTHNDFCARHLLVKGSKLSGVIDFGQVSGETPVNEFAKWDYWEGAALPVDWLKEGYGDKSLFGDRFEALFRLTRIMNGLCGLNWYDQRGYLHGVEEAKRKLYEDLATLST
jgi:aminoglycoside phosphotransferase (APT) family kinase protein